MSDRTTTITITEVDDRLINDLKNAIGEKNLVAIFRFCIREQHKKIFGENAIYGEQKIGNGDKIRR